MKKYLSWLVVILFLITGISSILNGGVSGIGAGICFFIATFFMIPTSITKIENSINRPVRIIFILFFWILGGYFYQKTEKKVSKWDSKNVDTQIQKTSPNVDTKLKLDSIISMIKKDKDNKVKSIEYTTDSTLKIEVSNKIDGITAKGVDVMYDVLKLGNVQQIDVYYNGNKTTSFGFRSSREEDEFRRKYVAPWDGSCRPLEKAIKDEMNDPDSYKHKSTFITHQTNGNYAVKTIFYGKNAYGGKVQSVVLAEVSKDGEVVSMKYDN